MENLSYDALVELITKEVVKLLADNKIASVDCNGNVDKRPLALVVGDCASLPGFAGDKYRFESIEKYEGDISPFDAVFIAELHILQHNRIILRCLTVVLRTVKLGHS